MSSGGGWRLIRESRLQVTEPPGPGDREQKWALRQRCRGRGTAKTHRRLGGATEHGV